MNIKKRPKKKVTKGTWGVEVDGKEYEVKGKTVEKYNRDGTVRVRKFKSKGEKGSPIKRGKPPFTGLEDIPRLTSTPKEYNLPYSLVRDCGLVQVPNEALMGLTPALLKQLNVQPQPDSVVIETKSGRRLVGYANIQRQIDKG